MQLGSVSVIPTASQRQRGESAEVLLVEEIGAEVRRIVLVAPSLLRCDWRLGQTLEVMVATAHWRSYAIAGLDPDLGRVELVVSLGGTGPGALWAACAGPGDPVRVRGPVGLGLFDVAHRRCVLVGDDTSLGIAIGLAHLRSAIQVDGILELPSWSTAPVARLDLPFEVVVRRPGSPGVFAARILDAIGPEDALHHVVGASSFITRIAQVLAAAGAPWRAVVTRRSTL